MNFIFDPSLVLYLPLYELDGATIASRDAYGHLCTVTGASWRPNGRYFDGVDDKIDCGLADSLKIQNGTILLWVKPTQTGAFQRVINTCPGNARNGYSLGINTNGTLQGIVGDAAGYNSVNGLTDIDDSIWSLAGFRFDATDIRVFVDGVEDDASPTARTKTITWVNNLFIGTTPDLSLDYTGTIGEVLIYNRALTPLEIQHIYLATKERYR